MTDDPVAWFAWVRTPFGRWAPAIFHHTKPQAQRADGRKVPISDPQPLAPADLDAGLDALARRFAKTKPE